MKDIGEEMYFHTTFKKKSTGTSADMSVIENLSSQILKSVLKPKVSYIGL